MLARFVMARNACLETLYEKVSETLIGINASNAYDCLCYFSFDFEKVLTPSNSKILFKFSSLPIYLFT